MTTLAATFNAADKTTPGHYGPCQTALLLLDFHSMFVQRAGVPQAPAALSVAARMRTWAKSQGIQVIHCLLDINATPFPTCKDADRLVGIAAAMKSGGGSEEPTELLEGGGDDLDITFTRTPGHVSALKSPGLEDFLGKKGIKSLVLTGLSTSGCVMRTAVTASDAEYVVSVISDGCADQAEDVHEMMVGKVCNNRGYVVTAAEFQEGFAKVMGENEGFWKGAEGRIFSFLLR
ncbi:Isochorismatase hydrolase [Lindgomyces ingoldianus]|uniref:Isochorismatase hydrolase n=1 Tax=Lindgomyces ingoldianus TaxID=673940 RepID=A0ACB6R2I5_9PLEO|nr:Isochorismatase hydrolase [Lindgomyces ingoldianus]KAF2472722.1 Isochorismatase hydrolase [Lindgomyces ingoldianus]